MSASWVGTLGVIAGDIAGWMGSVAGSMQEGESVAGCDVGGCVGQSNGFVTRHQQVPLMRRVNNLAGLPNHREANVTCSIIPRCR